MGAAGLAILALLLAGSAHAQDQGPDIVIDTNVFCDTREQIERFLLHFRGNGRSVESAIEVVNREEEMSDACVLATAAYRPGATVATVRQGDDVFDIKRIVVIAVHTLYGLEQSLPTEFFTVVPRDTELDTVGRRP